MSARPEPPPRTMCCPICGHELGVMPPEATHAWTPQHRLLLHKLEQFGFGPKLLARVFGLKPESIAQRQCKERRAARHHVKDAGRVRTGAGMVEW